MSRLPTFFLVGAPKAGTTSLYHYLDQHPEIYMSSIKEPCFFSTEIREEYLDPELKSHHLRDAPALRQFLSGPMLEKRFGGIVDNWDDYLRLFSNAKDEKALGEASVCYLWSRAAPERIAERIPGAKILVLLRDPAERAFSQYLHGVSAGFISWSFREHVQRCLNPRSTQFSTCYPFLELGLYSSQVSRYVELFGQNVWIGFHEDFRARPLEAFQSICQFLGVDPEFRPETSQRYLEPQVPRLPIVRWLKRSGVWQSVAKRTPKRLRPLICRSLVQRPGTTRLDAEDRRFLVEYYRDDVQRLAGLLGRNLEAWTRPSKG